MLLLLLIVTVVTSTLNVVIIADQESMHQNRITFPLLLSLLFFQWIDTAMAANTDKSEKPAAKLRYGLGFGMAYLPDYVGSAQSSLFALPFPYLEYEGEHLTIKEEQAHWTWSINRRSGHNYDHEGGVSISGFVTPPVKSEPDNMRFDMPDIDPIIELGPSLIFRSSRKVKWTPLSRHRF